MARPALLHLSWRRNGDGYDVALAVNRLLAHNHPVWWFVTASGILEAVLALVALRHGVVPGVATLRGLDPTLAPVPVSPQPQRPRSDIGLVLSRGFGGINVALLVRAFPPSHN